LAPEILAAVPLGGLLIFKGLFWLVIHNSTIPIVQGGRDNLYSLLTTYYLPPPLGYALAAMDTNTLSLVYLGVSKTARNQRVSSSLISKLKEGGTPIITDVRSNNTSSMVERFEHFEFVKSDVNADRTKLRWEKRATPARREIR